MFNLRELMSHTMVQREHFVFLVRWDQWHKQKIYIQSNLFTFWLLSPSKDNYFLPVVFMVYYSNECQIEHFLIGTDWLDLVSMAAAQAFKSWSWSLINSKGQIRGAQFKWVHGLLMSFHHEFPKHHLKLCRIVVHMHDTADLRHFRLGKM